MKILALALLLIVVFESKSQGNYAKPARDTVVKVLNWRERAAYVLDEFWDSNADQIISKLGKEQYETIKLKSSHKYMPCQMQSFCEDIDGSPKKNFDSLAKKLDRLILYEVMSLKNKLGNGGYQDFSILSVPYEENKNWDRNAVWDTVYILIPSKWLQKSVSN